MYYSMVFSKVLYNQEDQNHLYKKLNRQNSVLNCGRLVSCGLRSGDEFLVLENESGLCDV